MLDTILAGENASWLVVLGGAVLFLLGGGGGMLFVQQARKNQLKELEAEAEDRALKRLEENELIRANAWLDGGTQLSIVAGTVLGGTLYAFGGGLAAGGGALALALIGFGAAHFAPQGSASAPETHVSKNILAGNVARVKDLLSHAPLRRQALLQTWFWGAGALAIALLPSMLQIRLGAPAESATYVMALFSVGVALGAGFVAAGRGPRHAARR